MSEHEGNLSHAIGWYGSYTKESGDFCDAYSLNYNLDKINRIFTISGETNKFILKNSEEDDLDLNCGAGVILYSTDGIPYDPIGFNRGFLDNKVIHQRLLKVPSSEFEEFKIVRATEKYSEVVGTYKLTDMFRENKPVYKNTENGWFIFYLSGRFRLANSLENYTKGLTGQTNIPNGIFASDTSNSEYAVSVGVERVDRKLCQVNSRYMVRKITGAYFEKIRDLYYYTRSPRTLDEQYIEEISFKKDPSFLKIKNLELNSPSTPWNKFNPKLDNQTIVESKLELKYEASVSDDCVLSVIENEIAPNLNEGVGKLVSRYSPDFRVSQDVIDEPMQRKTIKMSSPPSIGDDEGNKTFDFSGSGRKYIQIDDSIGNTTILNNLVGFSIYIRFKPKSSLSEVLLSKWSQKGQVVSADSAILLYTDQIQNGQRSTLQWGNVKINEWNDLFVTYSPVTQTMTSYLNEFLSAEVNDNFTNIGRGNFPLIIGGYFSDVNEFEKFNGQISDIRIYEGVLSSDDVNKIRQKQDHHSNRIVYSTPEKFEYNPNVYMENDVSRSGFIERPRQYKPTAYEFELSYDKQKLIALEKRTDTIQDITYSTFYEYRYVINKWEFFDTKLLNDDYRLDLSYNDFCYDGDLLFVRTSEDLIIAHNLNNTTNNTTQLTISSNINVRPIISRIEDRKYFCVARKNATLAIYNVTDIENPISITSEIANGINSITHLKVINDIVVFLANGGTVHFGRINKNNTFDYLGGLIAFTDLSFNKLSFIQGPGGKKYVCLIYSGQNISDIDDRFKSIGRVNASIGYMKLYELDESNTTLGEPYTITPPYDEFGSEFLNLRNFGTKVVSDGTDNLYISCIHTDETNTKQGIVYWYKFSEELNKFVFVSRLFKESNNQTNFGYNIIPVRDTLIVHSEFTEAVDDKLRFAEIFKLNNVTTSELKFYDENRFNHEKYDDYFKMVAWYRFNEIYSYRKNENATETFVVFDNSGNYNHLNCEFVGNPLQSTFLSPSEGDATYLFGRDSHCNVSLNLENKSFTINVWYLVEDFYDGESVLLSMYDSDNLVSEKGFMLFSNGDLRIGTSSNTKPTEIALITEKNIWNMLSIAYDAESKTFTFYVNAVEKKKLTEIELEFDNNVFTIGGLSRTKNPFYGYIDDVKLYEKILTTEDIMYEFKKSWKFDWIKT